MATITAKDVNELRQITGAGMMDCKKALEEANGNIEEAIDILRKKGQKVAAKRMDKEASEGAVFAQISADHTEGIALSLKCETDFVAKNEEFVALGKRILAAAVASKPASIEALIALPSEGRTIADFMTDLMGKIGEKIEVGEYAHIKGEKVVAYIHSDGKIGVLTALHNVGNANFEAAGKDVGMQVTAMRPVALDKDGVDPELVRREKEVGVEKARQEGKPEAMLEKIAEGFVQKFYKENTLLNQEFIKDPKLTVAQYLNALNKGMTVSAFKRVGIGR